MTERIVSGNLHDEDGPVDGGLRPQRLADYVGQEKVKENLPHKELRQLEKFGDKYDHPVGGSHDLIQAIAGVVLNIKQHAKSGTGGFIGYLS